VIFGIEPGTTSLAIDINGDGSWGIGSVKSVQLTDTFDTGQPLRVTMILTADSQMVYFGSTLAAYVPDLPDFAQPLNLYFHVYPGDNILRAAETLTLDNISIWDLEKLVY
jgi:hypothetical protein